MHFGVGIRRGVLYGSCTREKWDANADISMAFIPASAAAWGRGECFLGGENRFPLYFIFGINLVGMTLGEKNCYSFMATTL